VELRSEPPVTSEELARKTLEEDYSVSRETLILLENYQNLLIKWAKQINLVGQSTIAHFWQRHILDCAQILPFTGGPISTFADFGTGAGLPGLILASLLRDQGGSYRGQLIEASSKRCGFLREAARVLQVDVTIHHQKIETVTPFRVDLITARAFAPLSKLLEYSYPWASQGARLIFFKGDDVQSELREASTSWAFQSRINTSVTDSRGCLVEITNLVRI
jgi:16S rRNA (guanine527-N7)-methyltransferase